MKEIMNLGASKKLDIFQPQDSSFLPELIDKRMAGSWTLLQAPLVLAWIENVKGFPEMGAIC